MASSSTSLQAAADGLLSQLLAHTGRKLDDDLALLLLEATSPILHEPTPPMIATRQRQAEQAYP
jgi:hypothetical protein